MLPSLEATLLEGMKNGFTFERLDSR